MSSLISSLGLQHVPKVVRSAEDRFYTLLLSNSAFFLVFTALYMVQYFHLLMLGPQKLDEFEFEIIIKTGLCTPRGAPRGVLLRVQGPSEQFTSRAGLLPTSRGRQQTSRFYPKGSPHSKSAFTLISNR